MDLNRRKLLLWGGAFVASATGAFVSFGVGEYLDRKRRRENVYTLEHTTETLATGFIYAMLFAGLKALGARAALHDAELDKAGLVYVYPSSTVNVDTRHGRVPEDQLENDTHAGHRGPAGPEVPAGEGESLHAGAQQDRQALDRPRPDALAPADGVGVSGISSGYARKVVTRPDGLAVPLMSEKVNLAGRASAPAIALKIRRPSETGG
jgi:hypothetical protein